MTGRSKLTILDAVRDAHLFAPWFKNEETWEAWFAFLATLFALPMTPEQLAIYRQCTGRGEPPTVPVTEAWLICGRRAGKSFVLALCAVFLACFCNWQQFLAPGERGVVMIIAADRKQARVIFRYIRALLTGVPMLARLVERETAEAFDLGNSITIEVATANYRSTRGYTLIAGLLDELAFWTTEENAANPDTEILAALRPAMATAPGAMLLCASSPYARRGALWNAYHRHYGKDGNPVVVWLAPTRTMNPTVPQSIIDDAMEADPASAAAEYLAQFRSDVESYIAREIVDAAVVPGRYELPPVSGIYYSAFCDPSGGSSDSMTMAIVHRDGQRAVLDALRERRPPFGPDSVVEEFAQLLRT